MKMQLILLLKAKDVLGSTLVAELLEQSDLIQTNGNVIYSRKIKTLVTSLNYYRWILYDLLPPHIKTEKGYIYINSCLTAKQAEIKTLSLLNYSYYLEHCVSGQQSYFTKIIERIENAS